MDAKPIREIARTNRAAADAADNAVSGIELMTAAALAGLCAREGDKAPMEDDVGAIAARIGLSAWEALESLTMEGN